MKSSCVAVPGHDTIGASNIGGWHSTRDPARGGGKRLEKVLPARSIVSRMTGARSEMFESARTRPDDARVVAQIRRRGRPVGRQRADHPSA